jgi:hypothetical protein
MFCNAREQRDLRWRRGERQMDIVELREFCKAMGLTLEKFVKRLERGMR